MPGAREGWLEMRGNISKRNADTACSEVSHHLAVVLCDLRIYMGSKHSHFAPVPPAEPQPAAAGCFPWHQPDADKHREMYSLHF